MWSINIHRTFCAIWENTKQSLMEKWLPEVAKPCISNQIVVVGDILYCVDSHYIMYWSRIRYHFLNVTTLVSKMHKKKKKRSNKSVAVQSQFVLKNWITLYIFDMKECRWRLAKSLYGTRVCLKEINEGIMLMYINNCYGILM